MKNIFKEIEKKHKIFHTKGATEEQIKKAEKELGRKFANDYKEYLSKYGTMSFGSTELTGLNIDGYLNVINATKKEMEMNPNFPPNAIVLENTGYEGILVLQDSNGTVYEWQNGKKLKTYKNLSEYLMSKLFS